MFYEVPRWYLNRIHIIDTQWINGIVILLIKKR